MREGTGMSLKSLVGAALNNPFSVVLFCSLLAMALAAPVWGAPVLAWTAQLGTSGNDCANGVAVDSAGNVYITGYTYGSLGGTNQGGQDAFLAKYSNTGSLTWKTQLGSSNYDSAYGVAVDSAGNAYIAGSSPAKYDPTGSLLWQLSSSSDAVALDGAGNAYFAGSSLAKYSSSGSLIWQTPLESPNVALGVALDGAGNAYVTGYWLSTPTLQDPYQHSYAFLAKYSSTGSLVWTTRIAYDDVGRGVAVDSAGNACVTGYTGGWYNMGHPTQYRGFLAKFDSAGSMIWHNQLGSSHWLGPYGGWDYAYGVAVDSAGSAYVTGETDSSWAGTNQGGADAFLAKYDPSGSLTWTTEFGSSGTEYGNGLAIDSAGNAYITGYTTGSLGGTNQGGQDAFLVKYGVPEPATLALLGLGGVAMLRRRK